MLLRLAYLGITAFAPLRLLASSDSDKDAEILALHQLAVLRMISGTSTHLINPHRGNCLKNCK